MAFRHISDCLPKGVTDMLKLHIGKQTNDIKVTVDDEDLTQRMQITGITVGPLGPNEVTKATFTVHADTDVTLLPEGVTVIVDGHEAIALARAELTFAHALLNTDGGEHTERNRANGLKRVEHALEALGGPLTNDKPYRVVCNECDEEECVCDEVECEHCGGTGGYGTACGECEGQGTTPKPEAPKLYSGPVRKP